MLVGLELVAELAVVSIALTKARGIAKIATSRTTHDRVDCSVRPLYGRSIDGVLLLSSLNFSR